jgi:NAD+ synthase
MNFTYDSINIDPHSETEKIKSFIVNTIHRTMRKRGAVIGLSGGIDSSVVTALCVEALGRDKVIAVLMPEKDSSPESAEFALKIINKYGISYFVEDMTEAVQGLGCYRRRDEAVMKIFPEYNSNYKMKIYLPKEDDKMMKLNVFHISITDPEGREKTARLPIKEYLQIVAASNFKQRSRMSMLYYHAEVNNYAVVGTANKNEHAQGFFVKFGDGGTDLKPIVHLFKTQVYQLAAYLDLPAGIINRIPTSDTYSAEQTQEEFFFKVPFEILDRIWYAWEKGIPNSEIAKAIKLDENYVDNVIKDIEGKIRTTEYLRMEPFKL